MYSQKSGVVLHQDDLGQRGLRQRELQDLARWTKSSIC